MFRIFWSRQASVELGRIRGVAHDRLLKRVELLAEFPLLGSAMDGPYRGFRQFVVGRYRVIYQVAGREIRIAYIRHGARQLGLRLIGKDED